MLIPFQTTLGFVGLGLIGGSIAKSLRKNLPDIRIVAYDINHDALRSALEDGTADNITDTIDDTFSSCDYIFLCAPVQNNISNIEALLPYMKEDAVLTDIGSVKGDIYDEIRKRKLSHRFIGGHPMAGAERIGYLNSKALLLENAYYIITHTDDISSHKVEDFKELVTATGAIPLVMDPYLHDKVVAGISHIPHVVSAALVNLVDREDDENGLMKLVAAGGFKDITRISSSSPVMWQQICLTNKDNISLLLGDYINALSRVKEDIDKGDADALMDFFTSARNYRESFIDSSFGPIKKVYTIHADIEDQPGMIARLSTLLADNNINIRNIGITHNREMQNGSIRIEFWSSDEKEKASALLRESGYSISD
ncbi:prephenate dehydrogenase [Butyrivibrio sp. MC2013]|uniref:prephenate dehydrogenase n=1 Tax=Butyrivibrio sp. MC2013 TaxID=1280686 RepID=UPI0004221CAF|nr:prephenate dehydrogenase [Butyrivibrio sp. MC2013]